MPANRVNLFTSLSAAAVALVTTASAAQFTVAFKSSTLPANATAICEAAGAKVVSQIPEIGVLTVKGPSGLLQSLGSSPSVSAISPTLILKLPAQPMAAAPMLPAFDTGAADLYAEWQWDIQQVTDNGASFNLWTGSHQTVVGVVDTGINTQHPDLVANVLGGRNFVPDGPGDIVIPSDFEDKNGHGSHTAGTVAANGRILGVGPNLGIRAYRVLTADGWGYSDWIMSAMIAAVNDGVDVLSISIGGYDFNSGYIWTDPETGISYKGKDLADFVAWGRTVRYAVNKGVVVVVSAGNEALSLNNPAKVTEMLNEWLGPQGYFIWGASREIPGTVPGVLTISATGPDLSFASYSNYGPGAIDLSAPGGDFQRWPVGDWYTDLCFGAFLSPDDYALMAGTSMATPKVAGVAALIIDQAKANGNDLMPSQVTVLLQQSSTDLGKRGYDMLYGHGTINAVSALTHK